MIRALALAVVFAVVAAAPADAAILSREDATELAQSLAEASEEQDICYGWEVENDFSGSSDIGSSTGGPGQLLNKSARGCEDGYVLLEGNIHYACDTCEDEDSASIGIDSNLENPPTPEDLEALGLDVAGLYGDNDDTTLVNMVNALPLIAADRGNEPYLEYEQATTVPATDHATNKPGSDFLRDTWIQLVLFVGLILGGPGFYFYKRSQTKEFRLSPQAQQQTTPTSVPPPAN